MRVYETFGVPLEPKILLIGFFLANDFWDAEKFDAWRKSGVGGNYMVWRDFGRQTAIASVEKVLGNSYLYYWARFIREVYRNWRAGEPKDLQLADGSHLKLRPDDLAEKTAYIEPGNPIFELAVDALERINAIASSHGTHVIVVLQPSKEETYLPLLDGTPADPGAPLRAALAARGIEYLDLLPVFREHAEAGAKLFYEFDGHPNAEGYRLIAKEDSRPPGEQGRGVRPRGRTAGSGLSRRSAPIRHQPRRRGESLYKGQRLPERRRERWPTPATMAGGARSPASASAVLHLAGLDDSATTASSPAQLLQSTPSTDACVRRQSLASSRLTDRAAGSQGGRGRFPLRGRTLSELPRAID